MSIYPVALEQFTQAYIECALWSSNDEFTPQGGEPLSNTYTVNDLDHKLLKQMHDDCRAYLSENHLLIEYEIERQNNPLRPLTMGHAGHDFWLTRNGHGAGFWDGDWPHYGDTLTEACKKFPQVDLYQGGDGRIYA